MRLTHHPSRVIAAGILLLATASSPLFAREGNVSTNAPKAPKNIIFLIGDGMGLAHVSASIASNAERLNLERSQYIGLSKTSSANAYVTDSGAGGTALACGVKTKNGAVGVDPDFKPLDSILKEAKGAGLSTGVVVTSAVTHATPASFVAHQDSRKKEEEIAVDYLQAEVDVIIGGGRKFFENRKDGRNLLQELRDQNYQIFSTLEEVSSVKQGKVLGLLAEGALPPQPERGEVLPQTVGAAIDLLKQGNKGFFLMVEGSQIDWASHKNEFAWMLAETVDFDKAIGVAFDFAAKNKETLVVITADHETGGLTLVGGDLKDRTVTPKWGSGGHTASMVPVYAFGPGAERFAGIYENTAVFDKLKALLEERDRAVPSTPSKKKK